MIEQTGNTLKGTAHKKDSPKAFATEVGIIVGGTTFAQLISMVTAPIVTRLYGADAFGLSAIFLSLVNTISVVACLRYEFTIMLPKKDEGAINLLALSLLINVAISLALIPLMWLFGDDIASLLNAPGLGQYLWLFPSMIFLTGAFNAINYWNSRKRQFERLATAQVSKAASTTGTQVGIGYAGYASGGSLIAASILGQAVATFTLGIQVWLEDKNLLRRNVNRKGMMSGMKEYRDFPLFDMWSGLINVLSLQLPIFILAVYFTAAVVGYYSIGMMVLQLPASFIGAAISRVFYQRAAAAYHVSKQALSSISEQVAKRLILIGVFPILLLAVIGQDLFAVVFGPGWSEAGVFAQILSFWILIVFVSSPMTAILNVMMKLRAMLLFNLVLLIVRAASLIWGGMQGDVYLTLALFSLTGALAWIGLCYWILKLAGVSMFHMFRSISNNMILGGALLLIVVFCEFALQLSPLIMVGLSAVCAAIYYAVIVSSDKEMKGIVMHMVRRSSN